MKEIPKHEWPPMAGDRKTRPERVWMSKEYFVQQYMEGDTIRLSINRIKLRPDGQWKDGITWDELQRIKRLVGYGNRYAIEIYPKDADLVKPCNLRHLWIPKKPLDIGWTRPPRMGGTI